MKREPVRVTPTLHPDTVACHWQTCCNFAAFQPRPSELWGWLVVEALQLRQIPRREPQVDVEDGT